MIPNYKNIWKHIKAIWQTNQENISNRCKSSYVDTGKPQIYALAAFSYIFGTCPGIYFWHSPFYVLVFSYIPWSYIYICIYIYIHTYLIHVQNLIVFTYNSVLFCNMFSAHNFRLPYRFSFLYFAAEVPSQRTSSTRVSFAANLQAGHHNWDAWQRTATLWDTAPHWALWLGYIRAPEKGISKEIVFRFSNISF